MEEDLGAPEAEGDFQLRSWEGEITEGFLEETSNPSPCS